MITIEELDNLAKLARIELDTKDKASLVQEFDTILNYVDDLKKVKVSMDTEGRVGAVKNITRPDRVIVAGDDIRERLLDEAPHREGDFVAVKKIIEQ